MGATADEIDREIGATRDHVDQNLTILERRAMKGARRYGTMVAIGLVAGVLVGGAAFVIYRTVRKPAMAERLSGMMPDALGEIPDSVREKLKRRPVRVVISTAEDREMAWESVARKVAPMIATSVAGALASRLARPAGGRKKSEA